MNWQEKMNFIIGEVLGEGYHIVVINDNKYETYYVDMRLVETESLLDIPSHWRKHVEDTILLIVSHNIKEAFKKLDNE